MWSSWLCDNWLYFEMKFRFRHSILLDIDSPWLFANFPDIPATLQILNQMSLHVNCLHFIVNVSVHKFIWNMSISFLRHRMFTFFYSPGRSSVPPPNIPLMNLLFESWILGFHSREKAEIEMEIFQYRKSRIWEMKEDKYMRN